MPKLQEADPTNRWLAHMPRMRVESELIRDIALAASGVLAPKIGGPSVYPPIPDGVLSLSYGRPMDWPTVMGEDQTKRVAAAAALTLKTGSGTSLPALSLSLFAR